MVLEDLVASAATTSPIKVPAAVPERGMGSGDDDAGEGAGFMSAELDASASFDLGGASLASVCVAAVLRDYQQEVGVHHKVSQSGAFLGDDMGLENSRQTVVATRMIAKEGRVLILCPASLRINWERERRGRLSPLPKEERSWLPGSLALQFGSGHNRCLLALEGDVFHHTLLDLSRCR